MQKKKPLKEYSFFIYLKDNMKILLILLSIYPILLLMFFLYNFPLSGILYSFLISAIPFLCLFIWDFFRFKENYLSFISQQHSYNAGHAIPPETGTALERKYTETIAALSAELKKEKTALALRESENENYYTLWVHQIKTPISALHLLLQSSKTPESAQMKQELFKIEQYTEMVLGYQRMYSIHSDFSFFEYNIYNIVRSAVKKFTPSFIHKKLSLDLQPFPNRTVTDEKWLLFAIEQILSNALKYTHKGGIQIFMDDLDTLYIKDSGIGISPEDLPRIFERGFTGYNGRMNKVSTGLGLYLAKSTLDKLNHKIDILSSLDSGTTVKIHLSRKRFLD